MRQVNRRKDATTERLTKLDKTCNPSTEFTVKWSFTNKGSRVWDDNYSLFQTGFCYGFNKKATPHSFGAPRRLSWSKFADCKTVTKEGQVEMSVTMTSPSHTGLFVCHWQLRDANQNDVGYPIYVRLDVVLADDLLATAPEEVATDDPVTVKHLTKPFRLGMNVNPDDPAAFAHPEFLKGVGSVRMVFKTYERERRIARDPSQTIKKYGEIASQFHDNDINVLFVLNQETLVPPPKVSGQDGWWQWRSLEWWTDQEWDSYINQFAGRASWIASSYRQLNQQRQGGIAYQIWNEGDEPLASARAKLTDGRTYEDAYTLPLEEKWYAKLLTKTARAIKAQDPNAIVVGMGLVSGREPSEIYLTTAQASLPHGNLLDNVDALAFHPYGCRPSQSEKWEFPGISSFSWSWKYEEALDKLIEFAKAQKGADFPIWITEIGPKPLFPTATHKLAEYMRKTLHDFATNDELKNISTVFWFPWADFNGTLETSRAGLIDTNGNAKAALWDTYANMRDWFLHESGKPPVLVNRPNSADSIT